MKTALTIISLSTILLPAAFAIIAWDSFLAILRQINQRISTTSRVLILLFWLAIPCGWSPLCIWYHPGDYWWGWPFVIATPIILILLMYWTLSPPPANHKTK